eukprot:CAMPEP_0183585366 /NCGR_PEP_ID=MMETSP0371-20130417/155162_1 /TAXON_ID=268820 /ORGANISM="Peridinium aciculiferum, Strain PAER-2" /LENGTH=97 /DNA_ID=CAMNT_0025796333 /DNA_START=75 /DNA_END=364 /DNA_ORIENTATION=-
MENYFMPGGQLPMDRPRYRSEVLQGPRGVYMSVPEFTAAMALSRAQNSDSSTMRARLCLDYSFDPDAKDDARTPPKDSMEEQVAAGKPTRLDVEEQS